MSPRGIVTNYALQSNGLYLSPWAISGSGIVQTTGQADPFGGTGATLWTESTDGAPASHFEFINIDSSLRGATVIQSLYVKAGARTQFLLYGTGQSQAIVVSYDLSALTLVGANGTLATQGVTGGVEVVPGASTWRRGWVKYRTAPTTTLETRWYIGASNVFAYQGNGSAALTVYGAQVEVAQPGQDSPSPYVASGATPGVGPRDTRQNGLSFSRRFSQWSKTTGVTVTDNTGDVTDPQGGTTAAKIVYDGSGASGSYRVYANSAFAPVAGGPFTVSVWLRTASGTASLRLANNQSLGSIVVTTTWQRFSLTLTWPSASVSQQFLFYSANADNTPFTVYAWEGQSEQANVAGDSATTNGAPFNPNGAPRSLAT